MNQSLDNFGNITPITDSTDWSEEGPKENCDIWINSHTNDPDVSSKFSSETSEYPTQYNTMFINNYIVNNMNDTNKESINNEFNKLPYKGWPENKLTNDGELDGYNEKQALCNLENSKIFVSPNCPIETRFSNKKKRQNIKLSKTNISPEDIQFYRDANLDDDLHFHQRKSMINHLDKKKSKNFS